MFVEQPASNQLAFHLTKLFTNIPSLCNTATPLLKLVLGELPMTKVRCHDSRSTVVGLCTTAGPAMEAATAILLIGRTLTRGAASCLSTASPPGPIRPEPPLDTDGHVVFCQPEQHPAYEVLLYRIIIEA